MSYTKGPWKVIEARTGIKAKIISENTGYCVAEAYHSDSVKRLFSQLWKEAEDNARLIAAAPELLEALELCSKALSDIINAADNGEAYSAKELYDSFMSDYNKAFEAIAKAKGE